MDTRVIDFTQFKAARAARAALDAAPPPPAPVAGDDAHGPRVPSGIPQARALRLDARGLAHRRRMLQHLAASL